MIIDKEAAFGEVIWRPDPETINASALKRFGEYLRGNGITVGDAYNEIWQWSVDEPERFWELFASFSGVQFGGSAGTVRTDEPMPHTQ